MKPEDTNFEFWFRNGVACGLGKALPMTGLHPRAQAAWNAGVASVSDSKHSEKQPIADIEHPGAKKSVGATSLSSTLSERGKRYGRFEDQAVYADAINAVYESSANWPAMEADQREALRNIAGKIARVLNGDPNYADNWHDIAGYATLVNNRLVESAATEAK